jgi:hypothetical protein
MLLDTHTLMLAHRMYIRMCIPWTCPSTRDNTYAHMQLYTHRHIVLLHIHAQNGLTPLQCSLRVRVQVKMCIRLPKKRRKLLTFITRSAVMFRRTSSVLAVVFPACSTCSMVRYVYSMLMCKYVPAYIQTKTITDISERNMAGTTNWASSSLCLDMDLDIFEASYLQSETPPVQVHALLQIQIHVHACCLLAPSSFSLLPVTTCLLSSMLLQ